MKNVIRYLGLRHMRLRPTRAILTSVGVAFGMALYVAISIINRGARDSLRENIESVSGKAKLTVSAGPAGFDEAKYEEVRTFPGVRSAVPMVTARAFLEGARETKESLYVLGVDLLQEQAVRSYRATDQRIIEDPLSFLNQPDSIVLTKEFAAKHGLGVESRLKLSTAHGLRTFTVRGLLEPEGPAKAYGGSLLLMDIDGARVGFGKEGKIDRIDVVPREGIETAALQRALEANLGAGFHVDRPEMQSEETEKVVRSYQVMMTFFSTLALLVGLFMVMNTVSVSVAERRREIGILRALGSTRRTVVALFTGEAVAMGTIGALLGALLGRALSGSLVQQVSQTLSAQSHQRIEVNRLSLSFGHFAVSVGLGVFASAAAALYPAWRASRIPPLEAMKSRGLDAGRIERSSRFALVAGFALLVFVVVSMIWQFNRYWPPFEYLTQFGSVLGAALFGPFVVFFFIRGLRRALRPLGSPVLKLAQENLLKSRRRTGSNIMALMVGLFLVMLISTIRTSFERTLMDWIGRAVTADIIVTSNGQIITADVQPIDERIQEDILRVPGVRAVEPGRGSASRFQNIMVDGKSYTLKAFDRPSEYARYRNFPIPGDENRRIAIARSLFESPEPTALVSENYRIRHPDISVGDPLSIDTPSGRVAFRVGGFVVDYASPNGVFYVSRDWYKRFWKDSLVTAMGFYLEPGHSLEEVRSAIDREVGAKLNLVTVSNAEMRSYMKGAVDSSFAYTTAIEIGSLAVALLGLLNTLLISVLERTREIGVLRAVGASRKQISRMILLEAVIQGGWGAVAAAAIGATTGWLWIRYSLAYAMGWIMEFHLPWSSFATTIGIGVVVSAVAGSYPAWRAARIPIVDALDYE